MIAITAFHEPADGVPNEELHDLVETRGVSGLLSEKDVALGPPLLREIGKARAGTVLVALQDGDANFSDFEQYH